MKPRVNPRPGRCLKLCSKDEISKVDLQKMLELKLKSYPFRGDLSGEIEDLRGHYLDHLTGLVEQLRSLDSELLANQIKPDLCEIKTV